MTKNEFDRQLFSLIMTQTFNKYGNQTKTISEDIFIHEFGEPAKSISEEERLQQHLISLSPLNLEKPKERLKVVLEKYICVQECFSKLNEEAYPNLDLIFYTFSEGGHGQKCLDSPKELEEFISYINKANDKTRLLRYAREVFHYHIPAYSLVCMKHEEHCDVLVDALTDFSRLRYKGWGLLNADTIQLFDKAPDKAQCISALLRNILYEHKIYRPKDANNQNDEAKKELQTIIKALHCSIKNVDKIFKECYQFDSLDKKQFISIVETYSHQKICEPSRFRMFSATSILDTETASEEKNDISEVVMSST